ncbi:hypothetical protein M3Y99_01701000 [Aphelenchoides fujianensis]|nr:hypothetical protein M3Y99_01701000 [Aphelenchoides fujianensis]
MFSTRSFLPFALLALLVSSATSKETEGNAEKVRVDGETDGAAEKNATEQLSVEFIPRDQLCSLCHSVITKFQQASEKNPEQFKNDLITSCALLKEAAEIQKCREGITDEQLKRLNSATVAEICVAQKLCREDEQPAMLSDAAAPQLVDPETGEEFEAIPDVDEPVGDAHSADDPKGFKTSNKAQDMIQNAYA